MVKALLFLLILGSLAQAKVLRDLPYAGAESGDLQKLDLYRPDDVGGALAVVIMIHGGGWTAGDKANANFVEPKTSWLMERGFMVVSINYRLVPAARHPAQVEDVCRAIAWVQEHGAKYAADPKRIYLLGHSAGAQLAALAAVDTERQKAAGVDASALRGVVLLDGAGYDVAKQYAGMRRGGLMKKVYRKAFGEDPAVQRDASPVHKVAVKPPPFLILHVAQREDSGKQAELLAEALRGKEGAVKVIAIPGKDHAAINGDCGKEGDPVSVAVDAFLRSNS